MRDCGLVGAACGEPGRNLGKIGRRLRQRDVNTQVALLLATALAACTPSINQAAKSDLDRRMVAMTPSDRQVEAPTSQAPPPLAVGQWITVRQIDKEQRPSLSTYKIVGADGDAYWVELTIDSYFGSSGMRMLVAFGDRTDPGRFELRAAFTRDNDGNVNEAPPPLLSMMRSTFQPVLDSLVVRWNDLPQADAAVIAGRFAGCYHGRSTIAVAGMSSTSDVWWHPGVPINGLVKAVGVGEPTSSELVDFGFEGATSTF